MRCLPVFPPRLGDIRLVAILREVAHRDAFAARFHISAGPVDYRRRGDGCFESRCAGDQHGDTVTSKRMAEETHVSPIDDSSFHGGADSGAYIIDNGIAGLIPAHPDVRF